MGEKIHHTSTTRDMLYPVKRLILRFVIYDLFMTYFVIFGWILL